MNDDEGRKINIQGTAVADTPQLIALAVAAETNHLEYQLPLDVVASIDSNGSHIVCVRPHLIPKADTSRITPEGTGFATLDITMSTALPCEVLIKLKSQKAPTKRMLSIRVKDYLELEQLHGPKPKPQFVAEDGQRRRSAPWN